MPTPITPTPFTPPIDTACMQTMRHRVTLAGTLRMEDGQAIEGLQVELHRGTSEGAEAPVDRAAEDAPPPLRSNGCKADGSFHFMDLPEGRYDVRARHARTERGRHVPYVAEARVTITRQQETGSASNDPPSYATLVLQRDERPLRAAPSRRPPR